MIEVENMVSEYDKIIEVVVYGVEILNINGCVGMVVIILVDGVELNEQDLV